MVNKTKHMMVMGLFVSMGIVLSYVERLIPTPFLAVGAKLGLANIVTLVSLVLLDKKSALYILLMRIVLVAAMFSGFSGFLYSFAGGMFSYIGMTIFLSLDFKEVSLIGISVIGAVLHSFGQVIMATIIFSNIKILLYFPTLLLTSLITGIFVGIVSNYFIEHIKKIELFRN